MAIKTHEEIPVSSIVLNPKNYRHRPAGSQEEALAFLFGDDIKRAEMIALATDIAQRGLDMSSLPIVEPVEGYWRVHEGNRRIASMKIMANPDVLPDLEDLDDKQMKAYRAKFSKVGSAAQLPRNILCLVTDDEEYIKHLIRLKHTGPGAHKGAGTVPWDSEGRARSEMDMAGASGGKLPTASNRQTASALALLDALETHFRGDQEMTDLLQAARKKGLTTIGRLLIKAENQLRLGVQVEGGAVRFAVNRAALRTAMVKVLKDLGTPKLNSRTTNRAEQVTDYLDEINNALPGRRDRLADPTPAAPPPADAGPEPKKSSRQRQPPVMRKPFPGLELHHASNKTRTFLGEIKTLRIEDYPYSLSAAIRMLIDLYTADVMRALTKPVKVSPSERARQCLRLIEPQSTKKQDRKFPRIADQLASGTGDLSIDTMNGFMHRPHHNPTPDTIRVQVDNYQPWLKALDDYVEDQLTATTGST